MQQLIVQVIMLIAYIIIFVYQFNTIKSLKEKFSVLEKFQTIFDLKKIEDYVGIIEKNFEFEKDLYQKRQVSTATREAIYKVARQVPDELKDRITELSHVLCEIILHQPDDDFENIKETFLDLVPLNRAFLERLLDEKRKNL